jgi:hypothetical protein
LRCAEASLVDSSNTMHSPRVSRSDTPILTGRERLRATEPRHARPTRGREGHAGGSPAGPARAAVSHRDADGALEGSPRGFLLDGFPRTVAQAHALDSRLAEAGTAVRAVVLVDVPDDVIVRRISGRFTCPRGHVYHLESSRPTRAGVCDRDGERLTRRTDDEPETVRRRLIACHEDRAGEDAPPTAPRAQSVGQRRNRSSNESIRTCVRPLATADGRRPPVSIGH